MKNNQKKSIIVICLLTVCLCLLAIICVRILLDREKELTKGGGQTEALTTETVSEEWSPESLREEMQTAIEYDIRYNAYISDKKEAEQAITEYGVRQREQYSNPSVKELELLMEKDFDMFAVNLGEIDLETAKDIQAAFAYMYQAYPELRGSITNVSLGNFKNEDAGNIAVTQNREFIIHEEFGTPPFVVKYEIIFNAAKFKNRKKLLADCEEQVETGHWPKGADITSIVVHELGHQLLNVIAMKRFELVDAYYITDENQDAYSKYLTDSLSVNQTVAKSVLETAYNKWQKEYFHTGTQEDFQSSISGYAKGIQADGGISFGETFAEAVADVYLNGEAAADASKAIVAVIAENIE